MFGVDSADGRLETCVAAGATAGLAQQLVEGRRVSVLHEPSQEVLLEGPAAAARRRSVEWTSCGTSFTWMGRQFRRPGIQRAWLASTVG